MMPQSVAPWVYGARQACKRGQLDRQDPLHRSPGAAHMIGQAHLDPVWLWPWQAGLDEVLSARTGSLSPLP